MGCQFDSKLNNGSAMVCSAHCEGVNSCFCDGSVHFISDSVDHLTWCLPQSKTDGPVLTGNWGQ
jgi:prepilin-type processing-associated H-X9-DG protein